MKLIRRDFFRRLLVRMAALGLLGKSGNLYFLAHAQENVGELAEGCKFLNVSQARTLEAIADQVIPSDDFPGGKEAGVLYFIDNALAGWRGQDRWDYVAGLEGVDESSQIMFGSKFSDLDSDHQIKVLEALERGEARGEIWRRFQISEGRDGGSSSQRFFNLVIRHAMEGYYSHPKYGGNKDSKSWTMIGYVGDHASRAPQHRGGHAMANKVDVVIVGAGGAGGIVGKELAEAGMSVVQLDKGRWFTVSDAVHDELSSDRNVPRSITKLEGLAENPRSFRRDENSPTQVAPIGWNAFGVGGGTMWYGAAAWRFHEEHFRMRSTYGRPEGTTLEDWPLTYDDLEPHYEKAEYELGVAGLAGADPFGPPRKKPYPVPPLPTNPQGELFATAARKLGLHPFPPPFAILTENYQGRAGCIRCPFCIGFVCEVNAKSSTAVTVIPTAQAADNYTLKTKCVVDRVVTDDHGHVIGVSYFDEHGQHNFQAAHIVVVSANAGESARLLLNSRSRLWPNGLANSSDQVGRNLMTHIGANSYGIFDFDIPHEWGPGPSMAVNDFAEGTLGGGHIYNFYVHHPIRFARRRPPGAPRWGKAHKEFQRKYFRRFMHMNADVADMPAEFNRVEIDLDLRDGWGIPALRITRRFLPIDIEHSKFVSARQREILEAAGAIEIWSAPAGGGGYLGQHQCGTCRMGEDPKTSVLNRYCQTHDVDNLFVIDTSCFVSFPGHNPSLTAQAIAYWSSDYIRREWSSGALRRV